MQPASPPVELGTAPGGGLAVRVALPPESLPAVLRRDLQAAWELSHDADVRSGPAPRLLRFARADGGSTTLRLEDRDALCWAAACGRVAAPGSCYGVSLLLRLLALVDLLGRTKEVRRRGGAAPPSALLAAAAALPLTPEARLDEAAVRARLGRPTTPSRRPRALPPPHRAAS